METDDHATVGALRQAVAAFVNDRDWRPFHTPKNLSMSIAIEAAELMERFQWLTQMRRSSLWPGLPSEPLWPTSLPTLLSIVSA
jgi:hypothetical protein